MGTDIHYWVERRVAENWEPCNISLEVDEEGNPRPLDFYCGEERNYALFAILADVKRLTNSGFEAIAQPRGFPPDSPVTKDNEGGAYYHNATWLSLKELLRFPWWDKKRRYAGFVDAAQYAIFRDRGRPECLSENSGSVVTPEEMDRMLDQGASTDGVLVFIQFGIAYAEFAGPFLTETLPLLQTLGRPEDVRLVMSFDS